VTSKPFSYEIIDGHPVVGRITLKDTFDMKITVESFTPKMQRLIVKMFKDALKQAEFDIARQKGEITIQ